MCLFYQDCRVGKLWLPVPQVRAPIMCHGAGLESGSGLKMWKVLECGDGGGNVTRCGLFKRPLWRLFFVLAFQTRLHSPGSTASCLQRLLRMIWTVWTARYGPAGRDFWSAMGVCQVPGNTDKKERLDQTQGREIFHQVEKGRVAR